MDISSQDFVKQLSLTLVASLGYFAIGLTRGWSGPAVPSLKTTRPDIINDFVDSSWITAISPLGAFTGSLLGGPILHVFGRKRALQGVAVVFMTGYLTIGSSVNYPMLLTGRFTTGFCIGLVTPATQVYVSECSKAEIRGTLGSLPALFIALGILISYLLGTWLPWNQVSYVLSIFPFSLFFLMLPLPESPSWLYLKGKQNEAEQAMKWLSKENYQAEIDRNRYAENVEMLEDRRRMYDSLKKDFRDMLSDRKWVKPFSITLILLSLQQLVGSDVVIFNSVIIFNAAKTDIDENLQAIIIGGVQVVTTFFSLFIVDKCGRKPLLYSSGLIMGLSSALVGIYFYFQWFEKEGAWKSIPLVGLILYMIGFALGYLTVPYLIMGEIMPRRQRSILSSTSASISFLAMSLTLKTYPDIVYHLGEHAAFWIYAGFSFLSCVYVWFFVPETKGRTLRNIEDNF